MAEGVPLPKGPLFEVTKKSDCNQGTDGTIEDDDGNAYTSTNCKTVIKYRKRPDIEKILVSFDIQILNAEAKSKAALTEAGTSVMFRQGMGYAEQPVKPVKPVKPVELQ